MGLYIDYKVIGPLRYRSNLTSAKQAAPRPPSPYVPRGEILTASEAARLQARRSRGDGGSAFGAWLFVVLVALALVWLLATFG